MIIRKKQMQATLDFINEMFNKHCDCAQNYSTSARKKNPVS